jgi:hypothetical protein
MVQQHLVQMALMLSAMHTSALHGLAPHWTACQMGTLQLQGWGQLLLLHQAVQQPAALV